MKKSVLLISLLSGTALALSDAAVASGMYATHTRTPRPEPVSFADMAHAYKTASVCFLGADNCGEAGFDSGNGDYKINTEQQCKNAPPYRKLTELVHITRLTAKAANALKRWFPAQRRKSAPERAATANTYPASVRPGLSKGNTAVKNTMFLPAKQYVRKLIPTTVITAVRFQRLMAVPNTGRTVPVNAKRLITTTAETGLKFLIHTAAKAIMPTVRQNVKLQKANPSVKSVLFTTATEAARPQANTTAAKKLWALWLM